MPKPKPIHKSKTKAKALLFDLDGTLLNTLVSLGNCFNRVLIEEGLPSHPIEAYRYFIGDGARQCVVRCLPEKFRNEVTIDRVLARQQADYQNNWQRDVSIYEGIEPLLEQLKARQIPVAVLSNKDHEFVQRCVDHFFPANTFYAAQGYSQSVAHKPDPTGALQLVRLLGLNTAEVALLGDTAVDIETASAAELIGVGALWGFRDRQELTTAGADYVIDAPSDILSLF